MKLTPEQQEIVLRQRDGAEKIARALRPWDEDAIGFAMVSLCEAVAEGVPEVHVCNRVRSRLIDYIRAEKLRKQERIGAEPEAEAADLDIETALAALSDREQDIFRLRHFANESAERIGTLKGITTRRVHQILARCRTLVRDALDWTQSDYSKSAKRSTPRRKSPPGRTAATVAPSSS